MPADSSWVCKCHKYLPDKLYGFIRCSSGDQEVDVFFHLAVFQPGDEVDVVRCSSCTGLPQCRLGVEPPPPILGERLRVEYEPVPPGGKAPRATRVERLDPPRMILGVVESFDHQRRYGFVKGDDDVTYHLHESEIVDGRLPLVNGRVVFYAGWREGRPRACHVRVCR